MFYFILNAHNNVAHVHTTHEKNNLKLQCSVVFNITGEFEVE